MTATPFDSAHLHKLFAAGALGKLFSDSAEIRAMMIVLGTLAKVQGDAGVIPETAARAIHRASLELQIDPRGLAERTAEDGSAVPALVEAFAGLMQAPDYAQYLLHDARPQDIEDSALMLRLRQALVICETEIEALLGQLAALARSERQPCAALSCGRSLLPLRDALPELRERAVCVSLGGGDAALRAAFAEALNLSDPVRDWSEERSGPRAIADWAAQLTQALALIRAPGETGTEASALAALWVHSSAIRSMFPSVQCGTAARFTEWLALPQLMLGTGAALAHARALADAMMRRDSAGSRPLEPGALDRFIAAATRG
ncbi:hypothetical protein KUV62_04765 [Salipiger bermudensis]|uniref:hypothetical protein n=1 Tax=Salipiger bermudensis TaxID=344736 RepID=UPI001C992167|nr:hypothetical protein [Salipiger bermudensis]MBY6003208.1 hypothetical protein [Salipiger bermudensis]